MKKHEAVRGLRPQFGHTGLLRCAIGVFIAAVTFAGASGSGAAGLATDDLPAASGAATSRPSWRQFALNALVVPLLEPDGPAAWVVSNELLPCRDDALISVDGGPVPAGRPLPLYRPMLLRFELNDCWPLGSAWIGLTGGVEVTLVNVGSHLQAHMRPVQLIASMFGARVPLREAFHGVVALDAAGTRP